MKKYNPSFLYSYFHFLQTELSISDRSKTIVDLMVDANHAIDLTLYA